MTRIQIIKVHVNTETTYLESDDVIGKVSRVNFFIFLVKNHFLYNKKKTQLIEIFNNYSRKAN